MMRQGWFTLMQAVQRGARWHPHLPHSHKRTHTAIFICRFICHAGTLLLVWHSMLCHFIQMLCHSSKSLIQMKYIVKFM
jgi:hypothetical protein